MAITGLKFQHGTAADAARDAEVAGEVDVIILYSLREGGFDWAASSIISGHYDGAEMEVVGRWTLDGGKLVEVNR